MAKKTNTPIATSEPSKLKKLEEKIVKKGLEKAKETAAEKSKVIKKAAPVSKAKTIKENEEAIVQKKSREIRESDEKVDVSIEQRLIALYNLQQIDSHIDRIRIIRGELPLEVQDLEDEIAGLGTRVQNYIQETVMLEKSMLEKKNDIKESLSMIKKYEEQQMNVRNNREYDSLSKEIEYQNLEIQLSEKRIREFESALELKRTEIERLEELLKERKGDLDVKQNELEDIIAETEKEENELIRQSQENQKFIEERLLSAYTRIRKNARNGLAVVQIERDACGGCFNKIPPQHHLDIRMHKKIIVCEYCGRILVDEGIITR
jgi:uncharacterized protein